MDVTAMTRANVLNFKIIFLIVCLFLISNQACSNGSYNSNRLFTPVGDMSKKDWGDPAEMERAWQAALIRIPNGEGKYIATTIDRLSDKKINNIHVYPTVIYLHGCSGVWEGTYARINFLAMNGYAVIAPVSFARKKYPKSCDPEQKVGGFYRGTLKMRQYDAGYAIAKAKTLSWVDSNNVFLMGFSQGGVTTATFSSKSKLTSVNARVIEGWTCNAGWHEYSGIKAPKSEPVLTLVGINDPWFQNSWTKGDCSSSLHKRNGSKSIVYNDDYLGHRHALFERQEVKSTVLQFLRTHMN